MKYLIHIKNCYNIPCMNSYFQISHTKENDATVYGFHSHDFYEIYFFKDGNVTYYIENESYTLRKGDILIIPPGKIHRPVIEKNIFYNRYVLWLFMPYVSANKALGRYLEAINEMIAKKNTRLLSFEENEWKNLTKLFNKLYEDYRTGEQLAYYTAESCIILILGEILAKLKLSKKVDTPQGDIVKQVIAYINANVEHAPTLEELEAKFYVSKYHLSRKFNEYAKTTIHQYILMKKVNLAKELLDKGYTPKEVSEKCGFSTYSNFYKVFTRQVGLSPKKYGKHE